MYSQKDEYKEELGIFIYNSPKMKGNEKEKNGYSNQGMFIKQDSSTMKMNELLIYTIHMDLKT